MDPGTEVLSAGFVGEDICRDRELIQAAEILGLKINLIPNIDEHSSFEDDFYVVGNFESSEYTKIKVYSRRIVGPPVLLNRAATSRFDFERPSKSIYSLAMEGAVLCFSGILDESEGNRLISYASKLGAKYKSDFSGNNVTHLIAMNTFSEKYRRAVSLGVTIMSVEWIYQAWALKDDHMFSALDKQFVQKYKLPSFFRCKMALYAFSHEESHHMAEIASQNGGCVVDLSDSEVSVVVVNDGKISSIPESIYTTISIDVRIVRAEWFWISVQMEFLAHPKIYTFENRTLGLHKAKTPRSGATTPNSNQKVKRRRLQDGLSVISCHENESPVSIAHIVANNSDLCSASLLLDSPEAHATQSSEQEKTPKTPKTPTISLAAPRTKRNHIAMELYQTETNYLNILKTIIEEFKVPLECEEANGNFLVSLEERKIIFDKLPPLLAVHQKIQGALAKAVVDWNDDISIGQIFIDTALDLQRAYPPFVNFFEIAKQTLTECDKNKPRFHAFLKVRETKPECGRQSLSELFIRPVQRLPSILLLLTDLLKKTELSNPDHKLLEDALEKLKLVTSHINEDKRKTESRIQMFEVASSIENIPPTLISSHRQFVVSADAMDITGEVVAKGESVGIFLFSDCLVLCKKRSRAAKSPAMKARPLFKYQAQIMLSTIVKIIDIEVSEDLMNAFALSCKEPNDYEYGSGSECQHSNRKRFFAFDLSSHSDVDKNTLMKKIAEQMSITQMTTDTENIMSLMPASELNLDTCVPSSSLSGKICKAYKKASMRVATTFSAKESKSDLTRNISTIGAITPVRSGSIMFRKKQSSQLDLNVYSEEKRKRTLPDRQSTLAESSVSLSTNKFLD